MAKKKKSSLRNYVSKQYIGLIFPFITLILSLAFLVVSIILWNKMLYIIISASVAGLSAILIFVLYIIFSENAYRVFYKELYQNNLKNLEAIKNNEVVSEDIKNDSIKEFDEINEIFDDIHSQSKGRVVLSKTGDYSEIPLEYIDKDNNLVSYESLRKNIVDIIISTKSFRNALIDISYEFKDIELSESEFNRILSVFKERLNYKNILFAKNKDNDGITIYIPSFDSVSQLEEEITSTFRHISIIKRNSEGKKIVPAHAAVVIYPYSAPQEIFNDLSIAKRSNKPINVYTPNKNGKANSTLLFENMNQSEINKASEKLDLLEANPENIERQLASLLKELAGYFSFTCVGYAKYNKVKKEYICEYSYSENEHHLINVGSALSEVFVNKLNSYKDNDNSYYFSNRAHVNNDLAAFLDSHNVKSGLFYTVMNKKDVVTVIYFVNDDKEMEFDVSIKQGLTNLSNKIGNFIKSIDDQHIASINARRFEEILKINNDMLYSINPETYELFFLSPALKSICPSAQVGEKCHKALYDKDSPCKGCPLKTKKHMVEILRRRKFETSVVLHNSLDKAEHLYLSPMERNKNTSDLFSPDFLISSYYSFCSMLEDEFALGHEGEVIFMNVDNSASIVKDYGNNGYISVMRDFFDLIKSELETNLNIYLYKNDNFALLLPTSSKEEVTNIVEQIYRFSKGLSMNDKAVDINISYYDFKYPLETKESRNWINHAERVMTGLRRGKKSDILYFNEDKYTRSASRETFMLNNVLEAFKKKKYFMEYQPIVGNKDRSIHGVELLLRLNDPFTNEPMNIGEAINIVTKNGHIDLVSLAVRDCLDDLFSKYDLAFFKSVGLDHMSINVEYETISNASFISNYNDFIKKNNIPKDFISFEIPERDIMDHLDGYRTLSIDNAILVCDQYNGELLRLDQLKQLHFKEVKISRDVILNIINDDFALTRALDVWKDASSSGIQVTFVGVEKRQQADLLHDDLLDSGFQGRFFYSPMNEEKLLKTLKENSIKEIADLDN